MFGLFLFRFTRLIYFNLERSLPLLTLVGGSQILLADCLQLIELFLLVINPASLHLDVVLGFSNLGVARFGGGDALYQGAFFLLERFNLVVEPLLGCR